MSCQGPDSIDIAVPLLDFFRHCRPLIDFLGTVRVVHVAHMADVADGKMRVHRGERRRLSGSQR